QFIREENLDTFNVGGHDAIQGRHIHSHAVHKKLHGNPATSVVVAGNEKKLALGIVGNAGKCCLQAHDEVVAALQSIGTDLVVGHTQPGKRRVDRKSTRLNSSHVKISYAVFCLKKKKTKRQRKERTKKPRRGNGK